jgi:hypothetical protein
MQKKKMTFFIAQSQTTVMKHTHSPLRILDLGSLLTLLLPKKIFVNLFFLQSTGTGGRYTKSKQVVETRKNVIHELIYFLPIYTHIC